MRKFLIVAMLIIPFNSFAYEIETTSFDIDTDAMIKEINMNVDAELNTLMGWVWDWEENFDIYMKNFETNLDNQFSEMERHFDTMFKWIMSDLDKQMEILEVELEITSQKISSNFITKIDSVLVAFFDKLDVKSVTDKNFIGGLDDLIDKIGAIKIAKPNLSDNIINSLDYIWEKAAIEKVVKVQEKTSEVQNKAMKGISKEELIELKEIFELLWIEK